MPAPRLLLAFCALALAGLPGPARATELVVSLEPGATRGDATQLAATAGGRVVDAIPELGAYLVAVPGRAVALRGSALVRSVERNGRLGLAGVATRSWRSSGRSGRSAPRRRGRAGPATRPS